MYKIFLALILILLSCSGTNPDQWRKSSGNPEYLHRSLKQITDIMLHDIYSPPVASRIYAYVSIAAYEAARQEDPAYISLTGHLHGLSRLPQPEKNMTLNYPVAAVEAALEVGKTLLVSEDRMEAFHKQLLDEYRRTGMPEEILSSSLLYGDAMAKAILDWAGSDHYKEVKSLNRYSVQTDDASWKPTPPAYMKAVEPHWSQIRPFILDSFQQFRPVCATPFSTKKTSLFYKRAVEVYQEGKQLTATQKNIASFWDCNPFRVSTNGHLLFATKKISPGGHWINITGLVCRKTGASFTRTAQLYALVALTISDSFISCWDEKYLSNVIRPETYINEYIDQSWLPFLQTPPFPEYTSGHSVVSAAAATVLTKAFGDKLNYIDSTEQEFGIPARHFTSFKAAAAEAAVSRYYGGIHYMPSISNGLTEGYAIGDLAVKKLMSGR